MIYYTSNIELLAVHRKTINKNPFLGSGE